jgi:hypothetical protein
MEKLFSPLLFTFLFIVSCSTQKSVAPETFNSSNDVFDFNQNGIFEYEEYDAYQEYKRTNEVPKKAYDLNHDGKASKEERRVVNERLGVKTISLEVLEAMKKIPGITVEEIPEE